MKASPADQARLLEVQADDARLDGLAHRRWTLPVLAEIARLSGEISALDGRLADASTVVADLTRAQARRRMRPARSVPGWTGTTPAPHPGRGRRRTCRR